MITGGINNLANNIKNDCYLLRIDQQLVNDEELNEFYFSCEVLAPLINGRYTHCMCYLDTFVYVIGGRSYGAGKEGVLQKCERFSLKTRKWELIGNLKVRRCTCQATTFMNKLYVFAGYRGDGRLYGIEGYNELADEWTTFPLLINYPIEAAGIVKISYHEIIFFGGKDDVGQSNKVSYYDLDRKCQKDLPCLLNKKILGKAAYFDNQVIIIGGEAQATGEIARVGEWKWKNFDICQEITQKHKDNLYLAKSSFAQSY